MNSEVDFQTQVLPLKNVIFRMALRITQNTEEAQDVVQETMMKVWNRREQWQQIESMEAFCLTICRNLALDRLKRKDNQTQSIDTDVETTSHHPGANPEEQTVQHDRISLVRRLISELPEKQRSCMQLRDLEGKRYKDIADILGITEQQVKVNIFRARQTIRERFLKTESFGT